MKFVDRRLIFCLTVIFCLLIGIGNRQIADKSKFYGFASIQSIDYSSDLSLVATGSELGTVVWDSSQEQVKYTFAGNTKQVVFSPDNTQLAVVMQEAESVSSKQNVALYDLKDGTVDREWSEANLPCFNSNASEMAIAKGKTVTIANLPNGTNLDNHRFSQKISSIAFVPGDRDLAVGTADGTVHIYNLDRQQIIKSYPGASAVKGIKFVPQHSWLFINRESEPVEGRSLLTDRIIPNLPNSFNSRMSLQGNLQTSDSGEILSCVVGGSLEVYRLPQFEKLPISDYVGDIDVSPDGKYVAIGAADYRYQENGVKLINPDNPQQIIDLNMGFDDAREVGFSRDGTKLLAYGFQNHPSISHYNYSIQIWDLPTLKPLNVLDGYLSSDHVSAISPQKKLVAATDLYANQNNVFVWNLETGARIAHLKFSRLSSKESNRRYLLDDLIIHFSRDERQIAVETTFKNTEYSLSNSKKNFFVFSLSDETLVGEYETLPDNFSTSESAYQQNEMSDLL